MREVTACGMAKITEIGMFGILWMFFLWKTAEGYNLDTKFPIIYSGTPGDYFGYTVALHKNREGSLALVGAPRANSTDSLDQVYQPGVLFKCGISSHASTSNCIEVVLDTRGNSQTFQGREFTYYDRKDGMWLGVSLDIQQNSIRNDIVTCGHLWKNQFYKGHHLANGVCYVINSDLDQNSVTKLVPLIQTSKQAIIPPGLYYYAYGQVGISAAYSEDGKHLMLGAPGIYHWVGTVVSYATDSRNPLYRNPAVPDPPAGLSPESYLGYSVTSGRFFDNNDVFFAVGAPRDASKYGRVYIFKALKQDKNELIVYQKKGGTQLGEYFGASVLGINLNGDEYTDLLVGAPFYSLESGGDEGKVYVYLSNGIGLQSYAELMGGSKTNSRFGTAIANVGDLNQDGFNDVAIGAPYEDDKGAVYIYHGSDSGMKIQPAQKIEASEINSQLSGFGIHISRGLDIDSNQYPDILIGSYASSNAVLFRTHPVIQLSPKLIFSPKQINANMTSCEFSGENLSCVNVTACLWYAGRHVPVSLEFENEIFVEHPNQTNLASSRGFFIQNGEEQVSMISQSTKLFMETDNCTTHLLYIHPDIKDVITPIQILYRYRLHELSNVNTFDKSYPVIDPSSSQNITSAITFQTGCGSEDSCLSDLVVTAKLLGNAESGELTLGTASSITLAITVRNKGEPAYLAELHIYLPSEMPNINQDFCTTSSQGYNSTLVCDLGNPLLDDKEIKIHIKLDATKIRNDRKSVEILLDAVTVSTETNPDDNFLRIPLDLQAISDIGITGMSAQEQILYDEDDESSFTAPISHTYIVRNYGPSPLQVINILLYVPIAFLDSQRKLPFLTLTNLEVDSGKQLTVPAKCNDTYLDIKSALLEAKQPGQATDEDELTTLNPVRPLYNCSTDVEPPISLNLSFEGEDPSIYQSKKSSDKSKISSVKTRETIIVDCKSENVECVAIQCYASPFTDTRKIAQVTVSALVNLTVLSDYLGPWYRVKLMTTGSVSITDTGVTVHNYYPDIAQVRNILNSACNVQHLYN